MAVAGKERGVTNSSDRQIKIRQVTHVQASWQEAERGKPGMFILQLILDNGADEYILRPDRDDADLMLKLFDRSHHTMFDMERKVLMFGNLSVEG
jgi:hypothetical protein